MGKSSIVDALEYGLRGTSSLYPAQRQGVNWDAGAPHVRDGQPEIAVKLLSGGKPILLFPDHDLEGFTDDQRAWVEAGRNASFVLRRHMLLEFIVAQPRARYERIEAFMNLAEFLEIENALKQWKDQLATKYKAAEADVITLATPLRAIFELKDDAAIDEEVLLDRLNNVLRDLKYKQVSKKEELQDRTKEVGSELGGKDQNERLAALGALKVEIQQLGVPQEIAELLDGFIAAMEEFERERETRTRVVFTELLVQGKEVIQTSDLDECPLCEQVINRKAVLARLDERIAADERVTAARGLVADRCKELLPRVRGLAAGYEKFIEQWGKQMLAPLPNEYGQTHSWLTEMEAALGREEFESAQFRDFQLRLNKVLASHAAATAQINAKISQEGGGERRSQLGSAAAMIESLTSNWPKYASAFAKANRVAVQENLISRLHDHAVESRKAAVQTTFNGVAEVANDYYDRMHPGEGIATSKLEVREVGQGSANLSTEFFGTREHPLLHYSESHLDTLGLAYFLALRKYEATLRPEFKVLVLDDVMHSVDAEHRARVARVIKEEFDDHQVIITTHDLPFYQALRRDLGNAKYTYTRINNWSVEHGPVLGDPLTDFDRITVAEEREKLDEESLSAASGRFFEWLLREVTEALGVAIPACFKRRPVIGDMWSPLAAKLRKQKGYAAEHAVLVDGLEQNAWVRNECGAHYNEEVSAPTLPEVQEFARLLSSLHDSLRCAECHEFVSKRRDGAWRYECGQISYGEKVPKSETDSS